MLIGGTNKLEIPLCKVHPSYTYSKKSDPEQKKEC